MSIVFSPVWSWPVTILMIAGLLSTIVFTYPPRVRHLATRPRRTLITLRVLAALSLIFMMFRPSVRFTETAEQTAELVILADASQSMNTPDGPGGQTRRALLLKTIEETLPVFEDLSDELNVRLIDFGSEFVPTEQLEPEADDEYTAIGETIDRLRETETNKRLISVLLLSDGAQRAPVDHDIDPRTAAQLFAEQRGVPIHTVTLGTSDLSSSGSDVQVNKLLAQALTFEKKTVPVRAELQLLGAARQDVKVRILIEDRSKSQLGETGELVPVTIEPGTEPFKTVRTSKNSEKVIVDLSFMAKQSGEYKLAVEAVPLDGEIQTVNNRRETIITVRKGGLRVAYFDVVRPEQKFIRRLNTTANIQLDFNAIPEGPAMAEVELNPKWFEPGAYDVYIIGDVPASLFRNSGTDLLEPMALRIAEGSGLAMTGGIHNFGAGGYALTPLAEFLPVAMTPAQQIDPTGYDPNQHYQRRLEMLPTPIGLRHAVMQIDNADNEQVWRSLPPLGGATKLKPKSDAVDILAETSDQIPLLLASDTGTARVVAFAGDETWKWHTHGMQQAHQRFWQQMILWLAHQDINTDQPVWVRVEPRNFLPKGTVPINFGVRDDEGRPILDASFSVTVLTPTGEEKAATAVRAGDEWFAEFTETSEPGDYWVTVSATKEGNTLGLPARTRFIVDARDIELDNPAADPDLMDEIALLTGATTLAPEALKPFFEQLTEGGLITEMEQHTQINLWDNWPLLLVFVTLMTIEWWLRKRKGLV